MNSTPRRHSQAHAADGGGQRIARVEAQLRHLCLRSTEFSGAALIAVDGIIISNCDMQPDLLAAVASFWRSGDGLSEVLLGTKAGHITLNAGSSFLIIHAVDDQTILGLVVKEAVQLGYGLIEANKSAKAVAGILAG
ncbi:MAG: hypothetical protein AAFN74_02750 [Myxococcota bacterium]